MKPLLHIIILIFLIPVYLSGQADRTNVVQRTGKLPAGTIWFSPDKLMMGKSGIDTSKALTNFTLADNLYAVVIVNKTLKAYYDELDYSYQLNDNPEKEFNRFNYALRFYVDDALMLQWLDNMNTKDFEFATSYFFPLITDNKQIQSEYSSLVTDFEEMILKLSEGEHSFRMELLPINGENIKTDVPVLAKGRFTLTIKESDLKTFESSKTITLPEATLKSSGLEKQILLASKAVYENAEPVKAIITDVKGDWTYSRDAHDLITGRQIVASVVYVFPLKEICYIKSGQYYQSHQGNGMYDDVLFVKEVPGYFNYEINCDLINPKE
ncbi:MAG: hypothetical protein KDC05_14745 [Bacteroidales bacterium]|nr:hypothetical protein [Bacteroidales bacterium]